MLSLLSSLEEGSDEDDEDEAKLKAVTHVMVYCLGLDSDVHYIVKVLIVFDEPGCLFLVMKVFFQAFIAAAKVGVSHLLKEEKVGLQPREAKLRSTQMVVRIGISLSNRKTLVQREEKKLLCVISLTMLSLLSTMDDGDDEDDGDGDSRSIPLTMVFFNRAIMHAAMFQFTRNALGGFQLVAMVGEFPLTENSLEKEKAKGQRGPKHFTEGKVASQPGNAMIRSKVFIISKLKLRLEIEDFNSLIEEQLLLVQSKVEIEGTTTFSCSKFLEKYFPVCGLQSPMVTSVRRFSALKNVDGGIGKCLFLTLPVHTGGTKFASLKVEVDNHVQHHDTVVHVCKKNGPTVYAVKAVLGILDTLHVSHDTAELFPHKAGVFEIAMERDFCLLPNNRLDKSLRRDGPPVNDVSPFSRLEKGDSSAEFKEMVTSSVVHTSPMTKTVHGPTVHVSSPGFDHCKECPTDNYATRPSRQKKSSSLCGMSAEFKGKGTSQGYFACRKSSCLEVFMHGPLVQAKLLQKEFPSDVMVLEKAYHSPKGDTDGFSRFAASFHTLNVSSWAYGPCHSSNGSPTLSLDVDKHGTLLHAMFFIKRKCPFLMLC